MKKLIIAITTMAIALSFVSCGKAEETPAETTVPDYLAAISEINAKCENEYATTPTEATYYTLSTDKEEAEETTLKSTTVTTIAVADNSQQSNETIETSANITETTSNVAEDYVLVPAVDINISSDIDLSTVNINHKDINILNTTLKDVLDNTGIRRCTFGTTALSRNEYDYLSGMFGIQADENDITSFTGTQVSIEVVDKNGTLVAPSDLNRSDYDKYIVKGIHSSDFFTEEDFEVIFYKGIKVGMSKSDLTDILGEGTPLGKRVAYNNGVQTLIIEYSMGEVDEITLINN